MTASAKPRPSSICMISENDNSGAQAGIGTQTGRKTATRRTTENIGGRSDQTTINNGSAQTTRRKQKNEETPERKIQIPLATGVVGKRIRR